MFIALNGFEYQVYTEIHEVEDTADHRYQILCDTLQGRGCYDLEIEWQELCYRDLYQSFAAFATSVITEIHGMLNPVTDEKPTAAQLKKQVKALVDSCKNAAINFYTTANNFAQDVELPEAEKQYANFAKLLEKEGRPFGRYFCSCLCGEGQVHSFERTCGGIVGAFHGGYGRETGLHHGRYQRFSIGI